MITIRVAAAILSIAALSLAACGSANPSPSPSNATTRTFGPTQGGSGFGTLAGKAGNPVDLIHKLPGCKTDQTVGEPDLFGARDAHGEWTPTDPVTEPNGSVTWGQFVEVTTYPTHELAVEDLARRNPRDHEALLLGDLWVVELTAGQQAGKTMFVPSPQTVATELGGTVVHVWP